MKFKRYDKRFLPMLFIGLALWLGSIMSMAVLESTGSVEGQSTLMDMAKGVFQNWPLGTLLLLCLIQPVFEEVGFRLWAVGKKWMTIVSLVVMFIFSVFELGFWAFVFIGAIIAVWLGVKDRYKQLSINAVITSAFFALCHISGFGAFGWGMVIGLMDIFGMALVMCWLTINLSFWFSCLLHVCNNTIAIMWPLVFAPAAVTNTYSFDEGKTIATELRAFNGLTDNDIEILALNDVDSVWGHVLVGEPAEIAAQMLLESKWDNEEYAWEPYYDWVSANEAIEERLVYTIRYTAGEPPTVRQTLEAFVKDYEAYSEKKLVFDTTEAELHDIMISSLYDTAEVNINSEDALQMPVDEAMYRVETGLLGRTVWILAPYSSEEDDTMFFYALRSTRNESQLDDMGAAATIREGFMLDYVPNGKKVKLITVK